MLHLLLDSAGLKPYIKLDFFSTAYLHIEWKVVILQREKHF